MTELKPCLFCESEKVALNAHEMLPGEYECYVFCCSCHANGPIIRTDNKKDGEKLATIRWNVVPRRNERFDLPKDANGCILRLGEDVIDIQTGRKLTTQAFEITSFHPTGDLMIRCYDHKTGKETMYYPNKLSLAKNNTLTSILLQANNLQKELTLMLTRLKELAQNDNE